MKLNTINDGNKTTLEAGNDFAILFSYGTAVAVKYNISGFKPQAFRTDEKHSNTTATHISRFCNDPIEIPAGDWDRFLARLTAKALKFETKATPNA